MPFLPFSKGNRINNTVDEEMLGPRLLREASVPLFQSVSEHLMPQLQPEQILSAMSSPVLLARILMGKGLNRPALFSELQTSQTDLKRGTSFRFLAEEDGIEFGITNPFGAFAHISHSNSDPEYDRELDTLGLNPELAKLLMDRTAHLIGEHSYDFPGFFQPEPLTIWGAGMEIYLHGPFMNAFSSALTGSRFDVLEMGKDPKIIQRTDRKNLLSMNPKLLTSRSMPLSVKSGLILRSFLLK